MPPSSKSQGHRYVIAAALAAGESVIGNLSFSEDIEATLRCMETLGAIVKRQMDGATLRGGPCPAEIPVLDCGESGSTLRFLIPVVLALAGGGVFRGRGRLMQRPQEPYFAIFRKKGIAFSAEGDTLTIKGRLTPDVFELPGNVSSQFITGLMYALPLLDGDSEIRLTSPLESAGYVDMTRDALKTFGVEICDIPGGWGIPGRQRYCPAKVSVEADWSQGAFFLAALGLGHDLTIKGLNSSSCQGDRIILDYEKKLDGAGTVELNVRNCPDLVPALAARAALRDGEITRIREALSYYPEDIRRKKLAGHLLLMAQSGQYNYRRCLTHGETAAAQLAVCEFVRSAVSVIFLLNRRYQPYYKWCFRALRDLPVLSLHAVLFEYLLTTDNEAENAEEKYNVMEGIASDIIDVLSEQSLTKAVCGDLEKHAYSVNDGVSDAALRNMHILAGV